MVDAWLVEAMAAYNADSLADRDGYRGLVHVPGETLETIRGHAAEIGSSVLALGEEFTVTAPVFDGPD
ncbi:MAG: hypothetical protein MK235_07325, partial [Candidatus Poseidoniales archaeon]|nr:hypothetical protein [Candidatus Poseidoniales archaeon]